MTRRIVPAAGDDANDRLLTLPELAVVFRVPVGTVSRLVKRGKLTPAGKADGELLFLESGVRAFIKASRVRKS